MDGGYYAIKGFEYQIDKTLHEVLTVEDEQTIVKLEQIQDINTDDYVMQIKYKETSKFTPSAVRVPIIQLLKEYINNPTLNYILYCFFYDKNGYDEKVDLKYLNKILGKEKENFKESDKENFINKFSLKFSKEFQLQYLSVLNELKKLSFCNSDDEAHYFYSILVDYLRKKITNNNPTNIDARQVTQNEIFSHLNNGRRLMFMPAYRDFIGQQAYYKLLKERFIKPKKNQNTIFHFGDIEEVDSFTIEDLIFQISEKHYQKATYDIKPLTFIVPDRIIDVLKKYFIAKDFVFNDGYESIIFNQSIFETSPIINRKNNSLIKTSFKARILSQSTFNTLTELKINASWILINTSKNVLVNASSFQILNNLNTKQILNLI